MNFDYLSHKPIIKNLSKSLSLITYEVASLGIFSVRW